MHTTARTGRTAIGAALALAAFAIGVAAANAAPASGRLSVEPVQQAAEQSIKARSGIGEPVLAGFLLASALGSLAWLRSRQTRHARVR